MCYSFRLAFFVKGLIRSYKRTNADVIHLEQCSVWSIGETVR